MKSGPEAVAPTRVYIVRHGNVGGEGVFRGHVDVPLTPAGVRQMEAVAGRLRPEPLAAVYCSDLRRARHGAEIVARGREIAIRASKGFRELDMGRWDGRPFSELWATERNLMEEWWADLEGFRLPGGETLSELRGRVTRSFSEVLDRHRGETVCLLGHGGVNRVILLAALGMPLVRYHSVAQDYGCINLVEYYPDGKAVVRLLNG